MASLLRRRWTAVTVVACIALGTAAVAAVLTLVSAALLSPLPFPDAERLQRVWLADANGNPRIDLSIPEASELAERVDGVEAFAIAARSRVVARLPVGGERLRGEAVTPNYFDLLGVAPALGRRFDTDDYSPSAPAAVLISNALWRRAFNADPDVVGSVLHTEDSALSVVGVMPPGFAGSIENDEVEYWLPLPHYIPSRIRDDRIARQSWTLLRTGADAPQAQLDTQLASLTAEWKRRYPDHYRTLSLRAEPFGENWRAGLRANALLLMAAVLVLLAIAALNVSALLLARALDRGRELALRAALGASRWRIARQLLIETLVLVAVGGAIGALAATPLLRGFLALLPDALPGYLQVGFDPLAVALTLAALAATALLAGSMPAVLGSRAAPAATLAAGGRGSTAGPRERRLGERLVALELALTLVLLVTGSLLLRSYQAMSSLETGYRTDNVLRMAVTLDSGAAADLDDLHAYQQRLLEAVRTQPGVLAAGLAWPTLPPWDEQRLQIADGGADAGSGIEAGVHQVDPDLLPTLEIPLLYGRGISARDWQDNARVAVISAALAARLGGANQVIGTEIDFGAEPERSLFRNSTGRFRVVGVAGDVAWDGVGEHGTGRTIQYGDTAEPRASAYDIYLPLPPLGRGLSIAVHTGPEPLSMVEPLRRAIAAVAPGAAVHWVSSMEDELAGEYAAARFYTLLVLAFALAAVALASVGLFASLSQAVLRRRSEIGIRLALGASAAQIARRVVLDGMRTAALGVLAGLGAAWLAARALQSFLYGVGAADPLAFALAAALLLGFVLLASLLPARRAARVQPLVALQGD